MKALSIVMPWPLLILKFGKDVENRTWRTDYRGRILIHASRKPAVNTVQILKNYGVKAGENELKEIADWCGRIVGSAELVDCVRGHSIKVIVYEPMPKEWSFFLKLKVQFYRKYNEFRKKNYWYCNMRFNIKIFLGKIKDGNKWLRSVGEP